MKLVTANEIRALEEAAVQAGASWDGLMEQAGSGVANEILRRLWPAAGRSALILIGPGKNGGDGLVAARQLHDAGLQVALYLWNRSNPQGDANWRRCRERAIPEHKAAEDQRGEQLEALLGAAHVVVDGLLGTGVSRPVGGDLRRLIETLNQRSRHAAGPLVLAIDLPSGIDSDRGTVRGMAVQADITVATGLPKRGHRLGSGALYTGELVVAPIGLPREAEEKIMVESLEQTVLRALLPERPAESHKGTFGKVLVVAGSLDYPGAPALATAAASRSGVGLVTLGVPRAIYGIVAGSVREATFLPLPEGKAGTIGEAAASEVRKRCAGYGALLIGPGLGLEESTGAFLAKLLGLKLPQRQGIGFLPRPDLEVPVAHKPAFGFARRDEEQEGEDEEAESGLPPLVIDADGLNLMAKCEGWHEELGRERAILTPHPREMARLLGEEQLGEEPLEAAQEAAQRWGQIVVLKGATTVIAAPDGRVSVNGRPNAALASAGTGDVLAGLIAGLLAQGCSLYDAARLGVGIHSLAGAILRDELGDRGVVAGDLLARIPLAFKALAQTDESS